MTESSPAVVQWSQPGDHFPWLNLVNSSGAPSDNCSGISPNLALLPPPTGGLSGLTWPGKPLLWATTPSGLGVIIAVASPEGLCAVRIGTTRQALVQEIQEEFARAVLLEDAGAMSDVLIALRALALGFPAPQLPLDVQGTAFQARVWQALRTIPRGETRTYREIAEQIDSPTSIRAVASACARNPVGLTIPCHRVIRTDGALAGYAWGIEVKQQLLDAEREQGSPAPLRWVEKPG